MRLDDASDRAAPTAYAAVNARLSAASLSVERRGIIQILSP